MTPPGAPLTSSLRLRGKRAWPGQVSLLAIVSLTLIVLNGGVSLAQMPIADTTLSTAGFTDTTVTQAGTTYNIADGTPMGTNLFHSFAAFSVGAGDTANFQSPGGIATILSRVTGNDPSNIFGTIRSDSSANLFFLNPNGWFFGQGSSLNVNGSVNFSTANNIVLGEGPGAGRH